MAHTNGDSLRALQKALGAVSEFFEVHALIPKMPMKPSSRKTQLLLRM